MRWIKRFLRDNGLSIAFLFLFVGSLVSQSFSGLSTYNDRQSAHGRSTLDYWEYVASGDFLDSIFVNWQAAVLQLGCLIVFSGFLRQRGASHSRKPKEEEQEQGRDAHEVGRKGGAKSRSWLYRNSLGLAFLLVFFLSAAAHIVFGAREFNHRRSLINETPLTTGAYLFSSEFWFKTLQTWQAEFFGIWIFIILSIYLRQEGSAESKPVEVSDQETGETNK